MGWQGSPHSPANPALTQFQPGDTSMAKMLKVVRWALLRGGRFTPPELRRRFGCSKTMAYSYHAEWRKVFGDQPPPRARVEVPAAPINPKAPKPGPPRVNLDSLLGD